MSTDQSQFGFPEDFVWGVAASSYQIEGASEEDGKGRSVWDMFCEQPDAVFEGHTGQVAIDHYHRFPEDVAWMQRLGAQAYRLSLSWPRLLPEGTGAINDKGIAFYDRLIDALLEARIEPWVTLFHWDYPLSLFHRGGWLNRDSAAWFADYAALVVEKFSDRVRYFFTQNEPQVYIGFGHQEGRHAPGLRLPLSQMLLAGHHSLLAHGLAVQAMRAAAKQPLQIGYAPVGMPKLPVSDRAEDVELARRATFTIFERNAWNNTWWMDPVYRGGYPEQGLSFYGADAPRVPSSDFDVIQQPLDFFAVNIYQGTTVRPTASREWGFEAVPHLPGHAATAFNWPVTPDALYYGPKFFFERYGLPIVITENGLSSRDWVSLDGRVQDPGRIDFTQRYLLAFERAVREGSSALGYFHWSILDNFEWAAGYRERFGLIHVDFQTQKRTPKDSFAWYREVIRSRGRSLHSC